MVADIHHTEVVVGERSYDKIALGICESFMPTTSPIYAFAYKMTISHQSTPTPP